MLFRIGIVQDRRIGAEIAKYILGNLLHLRGVDQKRFAVNLLHFGELVIIDNHAAFIFSGKVILGKTIPFFPDVLRVNHIADFRQKTNGSGIFYSVDDSFVLRMNHTNRRPQRRIARTKEIVFVLKLRQNAHTFELNRGSLTRRKGIPQIRLSANVQYFTILRQQGKETHRLAVFVFHRNNKRRVVDGQDGGDPVQKL